MFGYVESGRWLKILATLYESSKTLPGLLVEHSIRGSDVTSYFDHLAGGVYPKVVCVEQSTASSRTRL